MVPRMFDHLRSTVGDDVELLHDVHERVPPIMAVQLAKDLEPYHLFFLEDVFAPEDQDYLRLLRSQTSIPIALGELYVNPHEYVPVVRDRLIDFIRVHISDIGGLTPARKLAALCEFFGVRTAWHGPGDVSPVGHAANLQLDLACPNFGIQEAHMFDDADSRGVPGLSRDPRWCAVVERAPRPRHRYRRTGGAALPVPRAPAERRMARDPAVRWDSGAPIELSYEPGSHPWDSPLCCLSLSMAGPFVPDEQFRGGNYKAAARLKGTVTLKVSENDRGAEYLGQPQWVCK